MDTIDRQDQATQLTVACGTFAGRTHQGLCRPCNEDRYLIKALEDGSVLLAVADGLGNDCSGGHAAGMIMDALSGITQIAPNQELHQLNELVSDLDRAVCEKESTDLSFEGMGSTLVSALLRNDRMYWVHAGDSRLFILRKKKLTQVTDDQTLARFLLAEGEITPREQSEHYSRKVMDQYVGCGFCEPETGMLTIEPDDVLLLSSDGLHNQISEEILYIVLNAGKDSETTASTLVRAALDAGGADNITVVVAQRSGRDSREG